MAEPLDAGLGRVRAALADERTLLRAVGSGRRRNAQPPWRRVEVRYVDLKAGTHLQVTAYDDRQAFTRNHPLDEVPEALDALLAEPFGNWHVESATGTLQLRVTKKGEAMVHAKASQVVDEVPDASAARTHDRRKQRLLPEDDPVLRALGISDAQGRVKPTRQAKYRQVEELVRALAAAVDDATAAGVLRTPTVEDPLRVVDLGCGNAYLTFAAHRYLSAVRGLPVHVLGIDVKEQSREHNSAVAHELGIADEATFAVAAIGEADPALRPDVVLALHACDTATDDALSQAVRWQAPLVLAAPCCHHEVSAQLRAAGAEAPFPLLVRDGIVRERFADTLTDALRAGVLRGAGYRVDVVEFVESRHTPRNTLIRAVRTGVTGESAAEEVEALSRAWGVRPRLRELLG